MAQRVNTRAHPSQLELDKVDIKILLELFPFAVILNREMRIVNAGEKILETWILQNQSKRPQSFWGSHLTDIFKLRRPKGIAFDWDTIFQMNLVLFELELVRCEMEVKKEDKSVASAVMGESNSAEDDTYASCSQADLSYAVENVQNGKAINSICDFCFFALFIIILLLSFYFFYSHKRIRMRVE